MPPAVTGAIRVRRLPRDTGPAGWNALLPEPPPARPLESRVRAQWLVVGAGFAGLAAARRLSQLRDGDRIVVLDASRVGEGPAGRNSGFMIDLPHDLSSEHYGGGLEQDREQIRRNRIAIDFAAEAAAEYGMSEEAFSRTGKINAAAGGKGLAHNRDYARHLAALGEAHHFLSAGDMRALAGTGFYQGGLYTPGTAMIQPALYVRSLAAGLARRVHLHELSPVTALTRHGSTWRASTPRGSVDAERVILAVNGHVQSFGFYPRRLMHIILYSSMTRALTPVEVRALGGEPAWGFTPSDPLGTTVRRISGTGGDRIIVRNRCTYDPAMAVTEDRVRAMGRDHDRAFARRFPMLREVEMQYRWSGRLCLSRNGAAAFGELEPGLHSACCQNGLGTVRGTLSGMLAAELAAGHDSPLVDAMLAGEPPARLPPEPFARVGARAVLRWKEIRAHEDL